jgi:hypothetical protein
MGKQYQLHKKCPLIMVFIQAMRDDWTIAFEAIKVQCSHATIYLIVELELRFLHQKLMNAIIIIYL